MFIQLKDLLGRAVNKFGMQRSICASQVCNYYRKWAPEIIHRHVLRFSKPQYFKDGILMIFAENSTWAQEIFLNREVLKKLINDKIGAEVLKDIKITNEAK